MSKRIIEASPKETADLFYVTDANSMKDRFYFDLVAKLCNRTDYHILKSRLDIARFVLGYRKHWTSSNCYDAVLLANHTLSHFRYILKRHPKVAIRTFDEGSGNFNLLGALHNDERTFAERVRDFALGVPSASDVFTFSERHFTVNAALSNVAPMGRLQELELVSILDQNGADIEKSWVNVVVGQPIAEFLERPEVNALMSAYAMLGSGLYLAHPRENENSVYPVGLERIYDERIIEHYVSDLISAGHGVRMIGPFTTSFFTINSQHVEKHYLHLSPNQSYPNLASKAGCEVYNLHEESEVNRWRTKAEAWAATSTSQRVLQ